MPKISVDFTLVDIHPKVCGAYGGCIFTIAGTGFQPDRLDITMGKTACTPLTGSTSTQVTCRLERAHTEHKVVYVGDVGSEWKRGFYMFYEEKGQCQVNSTTDTHGKGIFRKRWLKYNI